MKHLINGFIACGLLALCHNASAQSIGNISWQQTDIPAPLSGFTINYRIFGSSPLAQQELTFFLSSDTNVNTGLSLGSRRVNFNCGGIGFCQPPVGVQSFFVSSVGLPPATRDFLQSVQNACSPSGPYYAVGDLGIAPRSVSLNTTNMGTTKLPDFLFESGTLTPSTTTVDGSVTVQYSLRSVCSAPTTPSVGIFIADSAFNILGYVGALTAPGPLGGTQSFNLSFAGSGLPAGDYNLVLFADVFETVQESNENNNLGSFAFTLTSALGEDFNDESSLAAPVSFIDPTPSIGEGFIFDNQQTLETFDGMLSVPEAGRAHE